MTPSDAELLAECTRAAEGADGMVIEVLTISWPGPSSPQSDWVPVHTLGRDCSEEDIAAARKKLLSDRRFFLICKDCGLRKLKGHMFTRTQCIGCVPPGVVF